MSRKNRRQNRQANRPAPSVTGAQPSRVGEPGPAAKPSSPSEPVRPGQPSDRFLTVPEIAERLGFTDQAIRKWGRENKLPLRKLFGNMGPLGMAESQLVAIITGPGQGPGVDHGQPTA